MQPSPLPLLHGSICLPSDGTAPSPERSAAGRHAHRLLLRRLHLLHLRRHLRRHGPARLRPPRPLRGVRDPALAHRQAVSAVQERAERAGLPAEESGRRQRRKRGRRTAGAFDSGGVGFESTVVFDHDGDEGRICPSFRHVASAGADKLGSGRNENKVR